VETHALEQGSGRLRIVARSLRDLRAILVAAGRAELDVDQTKVLGTP
jgi:hypothetical protein